MKKWLNGNLVDMTQSEIDEYNQRQIDFEANKIPRLTEYYSAQLQKMIDDKAQEKKYLNGYACASYKDSTNTTWASEATQFIAWRDQCWTIALQKLGDVENNIIPEPAILKTAYSCTIMSNPTTNSRRSG